MSASDALTNAMIWSQQAHEATKERETEGKNRLVYISGAITGMSREQIGLFQSASDELQSRGYRTYIPSEVPSAVDVQAQWTFALCRDIRVITHCYGIAAIETYKHSKGASLELFTALTLQKELVLLSGQNESFRENVQEWVKWTQASLWKDVDRERYGHHTDIPPNSKERVGILDFWEKET